MDGGFVILSFLGFSLPLFGVLGIFKPELSGNDHGNGG